MDPKDREKTSKKIHGQVKKLAMNLFVLKERG